MLMILAIYHLGELVMNRVRANVAAETSRRCWQQEGARGEGRAGCAGAQRSPPKGFTKRGSKFDVCSNKVVELHIEQYGTFLIEISQRRVRKFSAKSFILLPYLTCIILYHIRLLHIFIRVSFSDFRPLSDPSP